MVGQVIDLVHFGHVGVTIPKSSYGWIYGSEKSVEVLLKVLIFDIHDGWLDMVNDEGCKMCLVLVQHKHLCKINSSVRCS